MYRNVMGVDIGGATRMGVSLFDNVDNKLLDYKTIRRCDSDTNLAHRLSLLHTILDMYSKYGIDILIFESIRLFTYDRIQLPTILSLCRVQTTIINQCSDKFPIYSVDVRSWKSRVLGSANSDKHASIALVRHRFPQVNLIDAIEHPRKKEVELQLNHDLADSICISLCLRLDESILQDKNKLNYK